jgi:pyrophosphatase PpaX
LVAILFDLEGTLVKSPTENANEIEELRLSLVGKLLEYDIPRTEIESWSKSTPILQNQAFDYLQNNFPQNEAEEILKEINNLLEKQERKWAQASECLPEAVDVLEKLQTRGYKIGLVTNTSKEAAKTMLTNAGISKFFLVVITRQNVKKQKPEPEGIFKALKELDENTFFLIGNSQHDSDAAAKAGGISIIVTNKPSTKSYKPDFFANCLSDALPIILSIDS